MKVKLVYRNYKPLHKIHESLVASPPAGVDYVVPPVQQKFKFLFPLYRKIRYFWLGRFAIRVFERLVFAKKSADNEVDVYQYINMIDENPPDKPYIVDIEHAASLTSFSPDLKRIKKVTEFLNNSNCKAVTCMSDAAKTSLKRLLEDHYALIEQKVHVIYPALKPETTPPDDKYLSSVGGTLNLLFVGNQAYLKGLQEVLEALKAVNMKYNADKFQLHVISADASDVVNQYKLPNVHIYEPKFSKQQIFDQFFKPADAFILPTKQDTFGMAFLDALVCGTAVIASDQFAIPELVDNKVDGFLVHLEKPMLETAIIPTKLDTESVIGPNLNTNTVEQLIAILTNVLDGNINLKQMGAQGTKKFQPGQKFSINTRNTKLSAIYANALV